MAIEVDKTGAIKVDDRAYRHESLEAYAGKEVTVREYGSIFTVYNLEGWKICEIKYSSGVEYRHKVTRKVGADGVLKYNKKTYKHAELEPFIGRYVEVKKHSKNELKVYSLSESYLCSFDLNAVKRRELW